MSKLLNSMALLLVWSFMLAGCGASGHSIVYSGSMEGTEIPVQSEVGGIVLEMVTKEGQTVTRGELLARMDDQLVQLQVEEAEAALEAAQANWEEAKAGSRSEQLRQAAAKLEQAQTVIRQAEARIRGAEEQIGSLQAVQEQLSGDLESARETLRYHEKLLNEAKNAYDNGKATEEIVDRLEESFNQARMQVNHLESGVKSTEAQIAQARHEREAAVALRDQAIAGEKSAQAEFDLVEAGHTDYQLRSLLALKNQAESRLEQVKLQADKTTVAAPESGMILRKLVEQGEIVKPSAPLYTLLKSGELKIVVYVPEANLNEVSVGQAASITVDAYPDETFAGKVTRIAEKAEFTPKNVQTPDERTKMVFAVTVEVTEGQDRLKPGMPADVRFSAEAGGEG